MKISEIQKLMQATAANIQTEHQNASRDILLQMGLDPHQVYQELEMSSRFVDTHQDISWSDHHVSLHSHSFYELLYCINTCGAEYLIGSERYRLQKGDIILIPPDISHRPILPEQMEHPYKRYILWLSPEFMNAFHHIYTGNTEGDSIETSVLSYTSTPRLIRTTGTKWNFLGNLFAEGVRENESRSSGWEAFVYANTVQLLVYIHRILMEDPIRSMVAEKPQLMDMVLAYIENNLSRKLTLEDVSKHFWVSQSTISQTFRKKLGVSFYRCVTQRRLIAAKALIMDGLPLEQINEKVGFSDYSTFYRAFKQEYGISPRQFRKLQASER